MNTATHTAKLKIIGRAKLYDADVQCDCCGRHIKNIAFLSDGRMYGNKCAIVLLGLASCVVDLTKIAEYTRAPVMQPRQNAA